MIKNCVICGAEVWVRCHHQMTCSLACRRAYRRVTVRQWQDANGSWREKAKQWASANRDKTRAASRRYYKNNRDLVLERARKRTVAYRALKELNII